ncbi:DUF4362 domain-containing protein [Paenisporosarcina sp. NPDC076898]|uniref:DUF4362 domain-containing protein n=1 Tax=unclassified Paenisporosarcina TaxID=2642018 RepID=UPI003D0260A0
MKRLLVIVIAFFVAITIIDCSKSTAYGSEEAIKRGDVVYRNEVHNLGRFEQFLNNVANKKKDTIRITGYTKEGDPIFQDLQFDGKIIQNTYNNSNDEYAGEDKGIETDVCTEIIQEEKVQGEVEFLISGCSKDLDHFLLSVKKNKLK